MNCPNCGAAAVAEARFCRECGKPLPIVAPEVTQREVVNNNSRYVQGGNSGIDEKTDKLILTLRIALAIACLVVVGLTIRDISLHIQLSEAELRVENYENRNAVDKTMDAIGSWLD